MCCGDRIFCGSASLFFSLEEKRATLGNSLSLSLDRDHLSHLWSLKGKPAHSSFLERFNETRIDTRTFETFQAWRGVEKTRLWLVPEDEFKKRKAVKHACEATKRRLLWQKSRRRFLSLKNSKREKLRKSLFFCRNSKGLRSVDSRRSRYGKGHFEHDMRSALYTREFPICSFSKRSLRSSDIYPKGLSLI